jgi:DHA1 family tetracycline resistance protein-like MFS transporter
LGVAPILLPIVVGAASGASAAGTVVAFFFAGQLLAPTLGTLADRTERHRAIYLAGYVLLAVGLAAFPLTGSLWFWLALAFVQGAGSAATNTVAAMFIVEWKPKGEWDTRIGWLQTFYGAGQAAGLGLAAWLQAEPSIGLWIAAALMVPGAVLGAIRMPLPNAHKPPPPEERTFDRRKHLVPRAPSAMLHHYNGNLDTALRRLVSEWRSRLGLFLASWFLVMFATGLVYNLYPLLMRQAFGIGAGTSSLYYAAAATLGVFAYAPSGTLGNRIGDDRVVLLGMLMTLASAGALAFLAYVHTGGDAWLVPLAFVWLPVAWSPLIVAGTALTAQLAQPRNVPEGEAVGLYNATTAVAFVLSAFAAGVIADLTSYGIVLILAGAISAAGSLLMLPLLGTSQSAKSKSQTPS